MDELGELLRIISISNLGKDRPDDDKRVLTLAYREQLKVYLTNIVSELKARAKNERVYISEIYYGVPKKLRKVLGHIHLLNYQLELTSELENLFNAWCKENKVSGSISIKYVPSNNDFKFNHRISW